MGSNSGRNPIILLALMLPHICLQALAALPNIRKLNVSDNLINGCLTDKIAALANIEELHLDRNRITSISLADNALTCKAIALSHPTTAKRLRIDGFMQHFRRSVRIGRPSCI